MRPDLTRVQGGFLNYIKTVDEVDLNSAFANQNPALFDFFEQIPEEKRTYRYDTGKWDLHEVVQHLMDAERIFSYRALRFARKDQTALSSFDENSYVDNSYAGSRSWTDLLEEFKILRRSTELLFKGFSTEQLQAEGVAGGNKIYVLALGYTIVGHSRHHQRIIQDRYLKH